MSQPFTPGFQVPNIRFDPGHVVVQIKIKGLWFTGAAELTGNLQADVDQAIYMAKEYSKQSDFALFSDRPEPPRYGGGGGQGFKKKPQEKPCNGCKELICFVVEGENNWKKVDPSSVQAGDKQYDPSRHQIHKCKPVEKKVQQSPGPALRDPISELKAIKDQIRGVAGKLGIKSLDDLQSECVKVTSVHLEALSIDKAKELLESLKDKLYKGASK